MAREKTLEAAMGGSVTFDAAALGFSPETHHHTVTVETAVTSYDVDIRIGGKWIRPADCTDVLAADAVVLRQVGFDAIKVTATAAGDVTLSSWTDPN